MRAFVAVDLDEANRQLLQSWLQERVKRNPAVRWEKPAQLHVTLHFVGDVKKSELQALYTRVSESTVGQNRFDLFPRDVQTLGNPARVLCLGFGLQPRLLEVADLVRTCSEECGLSTGAKPFFAHLTLGRVRDNQTLTGAEITEIAATLPDLQAWTVQEILFKESSLLPGGAQHRVVHRIPLDD